MLDRIIDCIRDDLNNDVGPNSSYTDDKVESIQRRLPETLTVNRFIGVMASESFPVQSEIGQELATQWTYVINIVIVCRGTDYSSGLTRLTKILRRVRRSLAKTSHLNSQTDTRDDMTESVYTYKITRVDFDSGLMADEKFAQLATVTLEINTEFKYDR